MAPRVTIIKQAHCVVVDGKLGLADEQKQEVIRSQRFIYNHFQNHTYDAVFSENYSSYCAAGDDVYGIFNKEFEFCTYMLTVGAVHYLQALGALSVHATHTKSEETRWESVIDSAAEQRDSNGVYRGPLTSILSGERERAAVREVKAYLNDHPNASVALVYGAAHDFVDYFDFPVDVIDTCNYDMMNIKQFVDEKIKPCTESPWTIDKPIESFRLESSMYTHKYDLLDDNFPLLKITPVIR